MALDARMYRGYLDPTVYNRLVNYYATDPVYNAVQEILGYVETVRWYDGVSEPVYDLVQRSSSLMSIADALAGQIISDYFTRVSDLVGRHGNLMWYSTVERVTDASELFTRRPTISKLIDFVEEPSPAGGDRFVRLQQYLNDKWYLHLANVGTIMDPLIRQSQDEGVGVDIIADRIRWYSRGDVSGFLGGLVSERTLPSLGILGDFGVEGLLGGTTWDYIRNRLIEIRDIIGDRDTPGTLVGDLADYYRGLPSGVAAMNPCPYHSIRELTSILLGIDEVTAKINDLLSKFRPF